MPPTRFVQEAMLHYYCKNWTEDDRVLFFLTKEAKINWKSPAHQGNPKGSYTGLEEKIKSLNIKADVQIIEDVPVGFKNDEIWSLFMLIYDHLNENEDVWFDVTHAFRSLPIMVTTILHYAAVLKMIQIKSITYGAFEASVDGVAPIIDICAMAALQEWIIASNNYLKYGDAAYLKQLADSEAIKNIVEKSDDACEAKRIRSVINGLYNYHEAITANRSMVIIKGKTIADMDSGNQKIIKPLHPLINRALLINQAITTNCIKNTIWAARIAFNQHRLQQAITILQEGIVSLVSQEAGIIYASNQKQNTSSQHEIRKNRMLVSSYINYIHNYTMLKNEIKPEHKDKFQKKLDDYKLSGASELENWTKLSSLSWIPEIAQKYIELSLIRNDLNHGGYVEQLPADELYKKSDTLIQFFEEWVLKSIK